MRMIKRITARRAAAAVMERRTTATVDFVSADESAALDGRKPPAGSFRVYRGRASIAICGSFLMAD